MARAGAPRLICKSCFTSKPKTAFMVRERDRICDKCVSSPPSKNLKMLPCLMCGFVRLSERREMCPTCKNSRSYLGF